METPDASKIIKQSYYERNRDKRLAYGNEYYQKNRERILARLQEQRDFAAAAREVLNYKNRLIAQLKRENTANSL
jgi:hypothetical protein